MCVCASSPPDSLPAQCLQRPRLCTSSGNNNLLQPRTQKCLSHGSIFIKFVTFVVRKTGIFSVICGHAEITPRSQSKRIASRVISERSKTVSRNTEYKKDFQTNMTDRWREGKKPNQTTAKTNKETNKQPPSKEKKTQPTKKSKQKFLQHKTKKKPHKTKK